MKLELDNADLEKIQAVILDKALDAVKTAVSSMQDNQPYTTRAGLAKYLGVGTSTVTHWVKLGMPYVLLEDGRKLYGKKTATKWLKSKEVVEVKQQLISKESKEKSLRLLEQPKASKN
ncbi:MAG: hypothetical protein NC090_06800 [Anaeroplasma bactoclasticum]|nr:hypothetical protein [Anaeroplasma bactoclasticum]